MNRRVFGPALAAVLALMPSLGAQQDIESGQDETFRFRSGVELINVTATVSDSSGRFVPGLAKDDFRVYEDDQPQTITHFSAERVPVSLGVVIDTSGSMAGEKLQSARSALNRLFELMEPEDEIFLYEFSDTGGLAQNWTSDRQVLARAVRRLNAQGGTAMYDAVSDAVPIAAEGRHRKKALVVISDGNDTSSQTNVRSLKQQIRESEILVYAIGIDGESEQPRMRQPPTRLPPIPFPFPPTRRPGGGRRFPLNAQQPLPQIGWPTGNGRIDDRLNAGALREITDDSGGRTEIVRDARDLDPATSSIADELSQQYYLAYPAAGKHDGRWHSIRVEVSKGSYRVRARRGYLAS
jgi:VWFA-related protein